MTISFKISEIFKKPIHEIFYQEPVIKDILEDKSLAESKRVAEISGIRLEKLASLTEIDDQELSKNFKEETLVKLAIGLGKSFEELFEK